MHIAYKVFLHQLHILLLKGCKGFLKVDDVLGHAHALGHHVVDIRLHISA